MSESTSPPKSASSKSFLTSLITSSVGSMIGKALLMASVTFWGQTATFHILDVFDEIFRNCYSILQYKAHCILSTVSLLPDPDTSPFSLSGDAYDMNMIYYNDLV